VLELLVEEEEFPELEELPRFVDELGKKHSLMDPLRLISKISPSNEESKRVFIL
jgi:hypothetical protein